MRAPQSIALSCTALLACAPGTAQDAARDEALRRHCAAYLEPLETSGLFRGQVLVSRGDEVLFFDHFGPASAPTEATRYCVISLTKLITTTAVMQLVQQGELALNDPVADHLPDWPEPWRSVTVLDLATHMSAIPDQHFTWSQAQVSAGSNGLVAFRKEAARWANAPLLGPPGQARRYGNFAFDLLGLLIEAKTGGSFAEAATNSVLRPAGMVASSFAKSTRDATNLGTSLSRSGQIEPVNRGLADSAPSMGLVTTARDLQRFARALFRGDLLDEATRRTMWTPRLGQQAVGWLVEGSGDELVATHSGLQFGYSAALFVRPHDETCVIVLSDWWASPTESIARHLDGRLHGATLPVVSPRTDDEREALAGIYGDPGEHAFVLRNMAGQLLVNELFAATTDSVSAVLVPLTAHRLALPNGRRALHHGTTDQGRRYLVQDVDADQPSRRLLRSAIDDSWLREAAGTYATATGITAQVALNDGTWTLRSPIASFTLVPVAEDRVLAMLHASMGSIVHFERSASGEIQAMTWTDAVGSEQRALRRP